MGEESPPGRLLSASGRSALVYEAGPGLVLRRYRDPAVSAEHEARTMEHLRRAGYPVPAVHDADGCDLVMERIEGPTMLEAVARRPWRLGALADVLADLHVRRFLRHFDSDEGRAQLPAVATRWLADRNVGEAERRATRRLLADQGLLSTPPLA